MKIRKLRNTVHGSHPHRDHPAHPHRVHLHAIRARQNSEFSVTPLYVAAFAAAFSAIAYELLLASYATFLLGATVFQYSMVISLMMASMGAGALLAAGFKRKVLEVFLAIELCLAVGILSAIPVLYYAFAHQMMPSTILMFYVILFGIWIGMEIPLLNSMAIKSVAMSRILFFDYLGGFLGGLLLPVWLLPRLGFFSLAGVLSSLNAGVAIYVCIVYAHRLKHRYAAWFGTSVAVCALSLFFLTQAERLRHWMEWAYFRIQPF